VFLGRKRKKNGAFFCFTHKKFNKKRVPAKIKKQKTEQIFLNFDGKNELFRLFCKD